MNDRKTPLSLPDHEATALVRSMMREQLMRSAGALIEQFPDHPKMLALVDPKRWEERFAEIIQGLTDRDREYTVAMIERFVHYWGELSEPARVVAAEAVAQAITGLRVYANIVRENPDIFLPEHRTVQ